MPNRLVGMVWASAVWCGETEVDVYIIASYHIYTWLLSQDFFVINLCEGRSSYHVPPMKSAMDLQVSASLDRSTARLADALKMAETLSGAQGSDLVR